MHERLAASGRRCAEAVLADRRLWTLVWARLRRDPVALVAAILLLALVVIVVAAPITAPRDPIRQESSIRLSPPLTPGYPLGADGLGRDILSRLIWGGRISLVVGVVPVLMAALFGITIGMLSGFYGGRLDNVLMRCLDIIFAFPAILLALAIVATLGPSISNAMLAITVVAVPPFARLIRASVLSLKEQAFVEAARALGAGNGRIVLPAHLAEQRLDGRGLRHPRSRQDGRLRGRTLVPGPGCPTADSGVGLDAVGGATGAGGRAARLDDPRRR